MYWIFVMNHGMEAMRIVRCAKWAVMTAVLPLLCVGATPAGAAPVCPQRPAAAAAAKTLASKWWSKAVGHYDKGQNLEAIAAWQCAYKLAPHPLALYNIGRSAVLAGKVALAVKSYEEYLRLMPNAANKAEVEATLRGLRKRLPKRPPPRRVAPPPRRVTPPPRRVTPPPRRVTPPPRRVVVIPDKPEDPKPVDRGRTLRMVGWSTVGLGVALAGLAGAFGAMSSKAKGNVENAEPGTFYSAVSKDMDRAVLFNTLTWVFVGVGAAAVTTGVALLVLGYGRAKEKPVTVTPAILRGGAAVSIGGTF